MKKHFIKRLLALTLVLSMVMGSFSVVHAEGDTSDGDAVLTWEKMENGSLLEGVDLNTQTVEKQEASQFASDEEVRVFIVLDEDSVLEAGYSTMNLGLDDEALDYADELEYVQAGVIEQISQEVLDGEELDVNYQLSIVTNAISAQVKYGQIEAIKEVEGVGAVYLVPVYELADAAEPDTFTAGEMVGSYQTWTNGYTGAGRRIAVIDTGLDTDHPSFDADAFLVSLGEAAESADKTTEDYDLLDAEEIAGVLEYLNAASRYYELAAEDLYINEKVPFGFNYIDYDLNVTHDYDSQGDHGTHVSGIAAANKYVPAVQEDGTVTYSAQEMGVVGIAPDAQLIVMKVFGAWGGAYADDYMAAIEDAILLGADSVNLSLGSVMAGFTTDIYEGTSYVESVFDQLVGSDTVVSISAGNDYSWGMMSNFGANAVWDVDLNTIGSPGSYANALTVASVENTSYTGLTAEFDNGNLINYTESAYGNLPLVTLDEAGDGTEYEFVLIEGIGEEADYEGLDVTGKVVLVYRGTTSFYEKHEVAEAMGAAALFVINNTDGAFAMNLASSTATIPCVSILQSEGESIKAGGVQTVVGEKNVYTGKVIIYAKEIVNYNSPTAWQISDFSSWGVPGDLSLKPEITAPGGNIYSTLTDGGYGVMSGTSMAAPSVAGMAALVMQYIEENNLSEKTGLSSRTLAQSLLMATAEPLMEGDVEYSPRRQGAGLANAAAATSSPSFILVGDAEGNDGKVKAELGDDPDRNGVYTFDFTIYNMSDETQSYAFDSSVLTEAVVSGVFIAESAYELSPAVDFDVTELTANLVYDFEQDGDVDDADAMLSWINKSGTTVLTEDELPVFDFDADGDYDTNDVYLYLCYINGTKSDVDVSAAELTIAAGESAAVTVTITLSDADREYLEYYFTNGIYIDAYIYVDSAVDMSIPMLAFYGNWTDSSLYENWDFLAQAGYEYAENYGYSNYLVYTPAGYSDLYYYMSNMYEYDEEYIADRNAISALSGTELYALAYSAIRNIADQKLEIVDAETGEVYFSNTDVGAAYSEFYYISGGYWYDLNDYAYMFWSGTDLEGNPLPDETRTIIRLTGITEYNVKNPDAELGNGVTLEIPIAIDNTAPEATKIAAVEDLENNEITGVEITVTDNRYVAAVYLFNSDGEILDTYAVNQTEYAAETTIAMDVTEIDKDVIFAAVIDYAGNETDYRIKISYQPDTEIATGVAVSAESARVLKGMSYQLSAEVYPEDLLLVEGVTWSSADETIATVDENGVVTGVGVGTTTITATTVAEPYLTAECEVEVFELPNSRLTGFAANNWNGNYFLHTAHWCEFDTNDISGLTKTSDVLEQDFFAATTVGDKIIAGTRTWNSRTGYSNIYSVDPEDGAATLLYEKVRWLTDMTYMPTIYDGKVLGAYAYNLNLLDLDTGVVVTLNLKEIVDGDYFIGVAYAYTEYDEESAVDVDYFYATTWTGMVYLIGLAESAEDDGTETSYLLYGPTLVTSTGYNANGMWYFSSLYYDKDTDYLFWSVLENDACFSDELPAVFFAIEPDGSAYYKLGEVSNDILAVCGLFKTSDLETSVNTEVPDVAVNGTVQSITAVPEAEVESVPEFEALFGN